MDVKTICQFEETVAELVYTFQIFFSHSYFYDFEMQASLKSIICFLLICRRSSL